jgi:hypothetical protein
MDLSSSGVVGTNLALRLPRELFQASDALVDRRMRGVAYDELQARH